MKKIFAVGAAALTLSAMILTFAATPAKASEESEQKWKLYDGTCAPDNVKHIKTCGVGEDASCTPEGTCP